MEGIKLTQIIGLLFIVITICSAEVEVSSDKPYLLKGEDITLTCRVFEYTQGNLVNWYRIYDQDGEPQREPVSENQDLLPTFTKEEGMERYSVLIEPASGVDGAYDVKLSIKGAVLEDTGLFSCRYLPFEERIQVDVIEEPQTITMTMDGKPVNDGDEHEMDAGEKHTFGCVVGGSNPAPDVTMTLHKEMDGPAVWDITNKFEKNSVISFVDSIDQIRKSLRTPSGSTTLENTEVEITGDYGNRFLTCQGSVAGGSVELKKTIYIRFKGTPPEFDCNDAVLSYRGEKGVKIQCTVSANPALEKHSVTYMEAHSKNASITIDSENPESGHIRYSFEREKYTDKYFMIVHIERVYLQMFRKYEFHAENAFGEVQHVVTLARAVSSNFQLTVTTTKKYANIGDDVVISCRVLNSKGKNQRYTVIWHKVIGDKRIKQDIGTNWYVTESPYGNSGRYTAGKDLSDESLKDVTFWITISNVQRNDTGKIGCNIVATDLILYEDLYVLSPVESIVLSSKESPNADPVIYPDGSQKKFSGEALEMSCMVKGAYPQPIVRMYIGDKDITDEYEQTALFKREGTIEALKGVTYDVSLVRKEFAVKFDYNNEDLKCVATVPNSEFPEASTQFQVQVSNYRPTFLCDKVVELLLNEPNVNISCRLMADPPVKNMSFMWTEDRGAKNNTIIESGMSGHYEALTIDGSNENEKTMVLKIDRVFPQMYRDYFFIASSDLGETVYTIKAERDPASKVTNTGASIIKTTATGGLPIMLSTFILIVLVSLL